MLKAAAEQDISVLMEIVLPQAEKSCNMPTFLVNRMVEGLFFMGEISRRYLATAVQTGVPFMLLDFYDDAIAADCVLSDNTSVSYTMTAHQKTVGIDSIRSTGDQCTEILALFDLQVIHFVRKNDADLIYFIGQRLIQGTDHEYVSLFQLVQIGKELGTGKSSVSGKNTVSIDTAYWKGASFDVTDGTLKDTFI